MSLRLSRKNDRLCFLYQRADFCSSINSADRVRISSRTKKKLAFVSNILLMSMFTSRHNHQLKAHKQTGRMLYSKKSPIISKCCKCRELSLIAVKYQNMA